jgi:hypothetical protein
MSWDRLEPCYSTAMDETFIKQRASEVRELAAKADPFTKQRLLDLADRYDARIGKPSRAVRELWANVVKAEYRSPAGMPRLS